jgi:hypothetical protein
LNSQPSDLESDALPLRHTPLNLHHANDILLGQLRKGARDLRTC